MKKIFLFAILFYSIPVFSQIKGLTEDGKEVVLFEDRTWKFMNESDDIALETIKLNSAIFEKDKKATFLIKSKKLNMGIYFNPKEWKVTSQSSSPYIEYMFNRINVEQQAIGFLLTEKIQIPTYKNLKDIVIANIQRNADYFRLKESEYRTVNGLKVLYLRYVANTKGLDFEYMVYYNLEDDGYAGVTVFSAEKEFEKYLPVFQQFLNGLVAVEKGSEVIEYRSPPPPMPQK